MVKLFAQATLLPINHLIDFNLHQNYTASDSTVHLTTQPVLASQVQLMDNFQEYYSIFNLPQTKGSFLKRKLFHEHLLQVDSSKYWLTLDPLFNINVEQELADEGEDHFYHNMRGLVVRAGFKNKVAFASTFRETQGRYIGYIDQRIRTSGHAFGQGRVKTFGENAFDFSMATAYLSYSPTTHLNFQLGNGKQFIGNGYRSHLLSDLGFTYPYIRGNWFALNNKLQFQSTYALLQDLIRVNTDLQSENIFKRNKAMFHYIEYSPHANFSLGLFEGNIWRPTGENTLAQGSLLTYLPLPFVASLSEKEKNYTSIAGLNSHFKLLDNCLIYAQYQFTPDQQRFESWQIGIKAYIIEHFEFQLERNHQKNQNPLYSHYSESLNLPVGGFETEQIAGVQFKQERWLTFLRFHQFNNQMEWFYFTANISYLFNPSYEGYIFVESRIREQNSLAVFSGNQLFFGLRTNLQNLYFDY
jgi:hypothetical protein